MSVKYQITLPDDLAYRMRAATHSLKIPLAQFIRETMEEKLNRLRDEPPGDDPFASIRGLVDGDYNCSAEIDDVIASKIHGE